MAINTVTRKRKALRTFKDLKGKKSQRRWLSRSVQTSNPKNAVVFGGYGFPDKLTTNLKYSQSFILTPTAVSPMQKQRFSMTSLYDPLYETGGGQPYWYDQLAAVYNRYKVTGAKITAKFCYTSTSTASVGPTLVGIGGQDKDQSTTLVSNDAGVLMSMSNVNWGILSTNFDTVTVTNTYSPTQAYGLNVMDDLQSANNGSPAKQWLEHVFINPQGAETTAPVNVFVVIEYRCEWFDLLNNSGS